MEVCKDLESVYARTVVKDENQPQSCEKRIELSQEGILKNSFLPAGDIDAFRCRLASSSAISSTTCVSGHFSQTRHCLKHGNSHTRNIPTRLSSMPSQIF